jgi:hypothetical protein
VLFLTSIMTLMKLYNWLCSFLMMILVCVLLFRGDVYQAGDKIERYRVFTRMVEFDYVSWTFNALLIKNSQFSLNAVQYLPQDRQVKVVLDYLDLVRKIQDTQDQIDHIYSDPEVNNPRQEAGPLLKRLSGMLDEQSRLGPLSETILQEQTSQILAENHLTLGGQPVPPLLYRVIPLPMALIISPRNTIRQDANISLLPGLSIDQVVLLENQVEEKFNVSAMITNVGGIGVYPTMVLSTTDMDFLSDTIAHEWTHNYLTLHPLGLNYDTSPDLRTMNETTASIVGKEIGQQLLERYYPQFAPRPAPQQPSQNIVPPPDDSPPKFEFRKEMHITRVAVDQLLADGKIEEAERYMEARRKFFWDHGYQIRRLNQAYFAFNGAYADQPGGAAGTDPVGPAVRALRQQSSSLADFLNRISWMTSLDDLQRSLQK